MKTFSNDRIGLVVVLWTTIAKSLASTSSNEADVCVIGAGMSGLGAAKTLKESGYSVIILEAQNRHGGRVFTDYESINIPIELGAQWIHGVVDNPLTNMVTNLNLLHFITDYENSDFYDVDTKMTDSAISQIASDYERVMREIAKMQESTDSDTSLGAAFDDIYTRFAYTPSQQRYTNFAIVDSVELEYGMSSEKMSMWWWDNDEELDGDDWWMPDGYDNVPNSLAMGCDIRYNQSVITVDQTSEHGVGVITTSNGEIYNCSKVIVTVPLGILKKGNITFTPELPLQLQHGINHLEMGLLEKHFVQFNETFWSTLTDFFYIMDSDDSRYNLSKYVEVFNMDHYLPNAHLLCLFSSGDAAYDAENHSDAARLQQLLSRIRQVWPSAPDPVAYLFTSWGTNPYTFGSYSAVGLGGSTADRATFRTPLNGNTLFFAGEHTSTCFPSTVHGAYLSGVNAANVLMGKRQDDLCSWDDGDWWYETVTFIIVVCVVVVVCLGGCLSLLVYRRVSRSNDVEMRDGNGKETTELAEVHGAK